MTEASPAARRAILNQWQGRHAPGPPARFPELFEAQVARSPGAIAVVHGGVSTTYTDLNRKANRLARLLAANGAGPERTVAVLIERSPELIAAILAVLKAGAAYLPVDTEYPAGRIGLMIEDARPVLVLTSKRAMHLRPAGFGGRTLIIDEPAAAAQLDRGDDTNLGLDSHPGRHPAYVLYTSGSTGHPKGVVIEHSALANYLSCASSRYPGLSGVSVWHSSVSFDMTVTSLHATLAAGGCVRVESLTAAPHTLQPCTFLKATPSHLPLLDAMPGPTGELMLGGEPLTGEALGPWRQRHADVPVINVYGPTEATVNIAEFRLEPGDPVPRGVLPLGRLMPNARAYVLDRSLRLAAPGVVGELYIAGLGLARGYLHRPALTAARFVADPYGEAGSRMYASGDLARWSPEGILEFAGRADGQVKIRGYRIEPGEIECRLTACQPVRQAAVVAREDVPGARYLAAYLALSPGARIDVAELRDELGRTLPAHMIPEAFVVLDTLPLTPNGKVDYRGLPAPERAGSAGRAPRTALEATLCEAAADLLGRDRVSPDDDFFLLGGNSLLAARLASRASRVCGHAITLRTVFDARTVAGLAAATPAGPARPTLRPMSLRATDE